MFFLIVFSNSYLISAAEFVGTTLCINCHQSQYQAWQGSHHDMAMRHATSDSVKADFNNVSIEFKGQTHLFFKKGAEYWVNIAGPNGQFNPSS